MVSILSARGLLCGAHPVPAAPPVSAGAAPPPPAGAVEPSAPGKGLAIAALVLGICTIIPGLGMLCGLIGLVLAIIALAGRSAAKGMAAAGLVLSVVLGFGQVLGVSILLPSLSRARELSKRTVCASNLRGTGQAMFIYANENNEEFPLTPGRNLDAVSTDNMVDPFGGDTPPDRRGGPSASLFLLIHNGQCTPKQFVCPSSSVSVEPLVDNRGVPQSPQDLWDFSSIDHLSYGYHVPLGPDGVKPNMWLDPRFALMADANPYIASAGETAKPSASNEGSAAADLSTNGNSRNHANEGQNVVFFDGHFEWIKDPNVGIEEDNIYTAGPSNARVTGSIPSADTPAASATDSIICP